MDWTRLEVICVLEIESFSRAREGRSSACLKPAHLTSSLEQVCGRSPIDRHVRHVGHKMLTAASQRQAQPRL